MLRFAIYLYGPAFGSLECDFEESLQRFGEFERLHVERDGSLVWRGDSPAGSWQIDGMIYDAAGRIQYVDLKGNCPPEAWWRLLEVLGHHPARPLTVLRLPAQQRMKMLQFRQEIWGVAE